MNSFLEHFIQNLPLEEYAVSDTDPNFKMISAIQAFVSAGKGKGDPGALLEDAGKLRVDQSDLNLCALFFGTWARLSWKQNRIQEGSTLIQRVNSLPQSELLPDIYAYCLVVDGLLASKQGNKSRREEIGYKILQILPHESPRRKFECLNHAYFLAQQGKAILLEPEIQWLATQVSEDFPQELIALIRFTDSMNGGRVGEAALQLAVLEKNLSFLDKFPFAKNNFYNHKYILDIMSGRWSLSEGLGHLKGTSKIDTQYAQTIRSLLAKCPAEALVLARGYAGGYTTKEVAINGVGFESFNLLRAELSEGNLQAAKRIMEMRHSRGNFHFLDFFFQARIELLNHHFAEAVQCLKKAIEECEKYHALGRLDFEIKMVCEWHPGILFDLMKAVYKANTVAATQLHPAPQETMAGVHRIIGESTQIREIKDTIVSFAKLDIPVLITGETGTGKELVAHALHMEGHRKNKKFIAVNCGAIAESLLESELFGHVKGAFTGANQAHKGFFETAEDGVLFLDEIGEISPRLQISLLRVLETGDFRPVGSPHSIRSKCRLIFATNANLDTLVQEGVFRKDLFYRLRRLQIHLPPLRERVSDIIPLADFYLNIGRSPKDHARMTNTLQTALLQHSWEGNVRELYNSIENMRLLNSDKLIYEISDIRILGEDFKIKANSWKPDKTEPPNLQASHDGDLLQKPTGFMYGNNVIRKEQAIKDLFVTHKVLTRLEISRHLQLSPKTVTIYLKELIAQNFICKRMPRRSPKSHYFEIMEDRN